MISGIALPRTLSQIQKMAIDGEIAPDSRWFVIPASCRATGLSQSENLAAPVEAIHGDSKVVETHKRRTIASVPEAQRAEEFRDAIPAMCRAAGMQVAAGWPFLIEGDRLAKLADQIEHLIEQAREWDRYAVHAHVRVSPPMFLPMDPASLADHVSETLTDRLGEIRKAITSGALPVKRGQPGSGKINIQSIFTSSAYKGLHRLAPSPALADVIKDAIIEAKTLADAIWAYAEPKDQPARPEADVRAFAAGLATKRIDSAIGQVAPAGHEIWATIMPAPSTDPAAALATPGAPAEPGDDEVSDLSALI